jgi:hypothetical protein
LEGFGLQVIVDPTILRLHCWLLSGLLKFGNRTNVRFRCFFGHLLPLKACDSCTSILTMG